MSKNGSNGNSKNGATPSNTWAGASRRAGSWRINPVISGAREASAGLSTLTDRTRSPIRSSYERGDRPSTLGACGMAVGLIALVATGYHPGGTGSVTLGAILGVSSGVVFGVAFTLMGEVSEAAGLMPVLMQRLTGFTMLALLYPFGSAPFVVSGAARRPGIAAGCLAMFAIAALQVAFQKGDSGPVSVAASQFATVAVILSVLFNRERMRWWQGIGVGATAVGVSLMALGS